jgi:hypothetical protein
VPVRQHLLGLKTLEQTAPNKCALERQAQAGLHRGHGIRIHAGGRVEDDTVTNPLLARHRLKTPIDHTDMEVHVFVQARDYLAGKPMAAQHMLAIQRWNIELKPID